MQFHKVESKLACLGYSEVARKMAMMQRVDNNYYYSANVLF